MSAVWWMLTAAASPGYPADVDSALLMPCTPQCTICHASNAGGSGTVVEPFGIALEGLGLTGGSQTDTLLAALDATTADSDSDGVLDVDELAAGDDPNGPGALCGTTPVPTPQYGCLDQARSPAGAWALVVGILALRRRR
jgi:hypothetical protein